VSYTTNGCEVMDTVDVTVHALPTGVFVSDSVCQYDLLHLEVLLDDEFNDTFLWKINGIPLSNYSSSALDTAFLEEGIYIFDVTVTSDSGCVVTYNGTSLIYPLPIANFSQDVACLNQLANFEDQSIVSNQFSPNVITEWEWSFPPNAISTEQNPTYNFESSGNTTVGLEVTTNHGCVSDTLFPIYVEPIPTAAFNLTEISGCSPICIDLFAAQEPNSDISISNYTWQFSNGLNSSSELPNISDCFYTESQAQTIDVSLTVQSTNGCTNTSNAFGLITVYPNTIASFSISPANPTILDNTIHTQNHSSIATNWSWYTSFAGNSTAENPSFYVPDVSINNEIILIANNQYDCPDTFSLFFDVKDVELIYVPNTFTPDGEQANSVFIPVFSSAQMIDKYHFLIFNRWGEVVFETHDPLEGWNGIYKGSIAQDGTFTWKIIYTSASVTEDKTLVGHVNLLR